jgi:hypothetical protein
MELMDVRCPPNSVQIFSKCFTFLNSAASQVIDFHKCKNNRLWYFQWFLNYTKSPEDATYGYISLRQTYTKVLTDIPFNLSYKIEIEKLFIKIVFGKPHYDYNQTTNIREEN